MQRTHRILGKRNGFVLIAAVFMMLAISFLLLRMMSATAESSQRTINDYIHEQAILITYAATEEAVLAVSGRDRVANGCIQTISGSFPANNPILTYTTRIRYIWTAAQAATLTAAGQAATCTGYIDNLSTPETGGSMLVDVYVQDDSSLGLNEPVRYHRRTLQKL